MCQSLVRRAHPFIYTDGITMSFPNANVAIKPCGTTLEGRREKQSYTASTHLLVHADMPFGGPSRRKTDKRVRVPEVGIAKTNTVRECSVVVAFLLLGGSQPSMSFLGCNCSTSHRTSNGGLSGQINLLESHPPRVRDLMILKLFLIGSTIPCFHVAPQGTTSNWKVYTQWSINTRPACA